MNTPQTELTPARESNEKLPPLFSRGKLFIAVAIVLAATSLLFQFVWVLPVADLQLPIVVVLLGLATFLGGQFVRHRLHRSWRAWTILTILVVAGVIAWEWHFGPSRRESNVARWIEDEGGRIQYRGIRLNEGDLYFEHEGWHLPNWVATLVGESYFGELRFIYLGQAKFGDADVGRLADIQHLQSLNLSNSDLTADGVANLPLIPGMEQLSLDWRQVSPESIARIRQFPELTFLSVTSPYNYQLANPSNAETRITDLAGLDQVEYLTIGTNDPITEDDAATIASLNSLVSLYILAPGQVLGPGEIKSSSAAQPGALKRLANSTTIEELIFRLNSQDLSVEELEAFAAMPSIKQISITNWNQPFSLTPQQVLAISQKFPKVQIDVSPLSASGPSGQ